MSSVTRSGSNVFIGGSFTQQQTPTGGGLVLSQGGSGEPDGSRFPKVAGAVLAAAADGSGGWFVGGTFTHVAGQARSGLAHILADGTLDASWNPNPDGRVDALAVSGSTVYAGGDFSSVGGQSRRDLAALDATTGNASDWNPNPRANLDSDGFVRELAVSGSTVYVAGFFYSIGGQSRRNLAAVDATTGNASAFNPDPGGYVYALAVSGSTVYAGGTFTSIGGQPRSVIAALDATSGNATAWNPNPTLSYGAPRPPHGPPPVVRELAVSGSTVYAAGDFNSIGGQPRNGFAALDATTGNATAWNPETGSYSVHALAVSGSTVYTGGYSYYSISGQSRRHVRAFDATTGDASAWNPNPNGAVHVFAVSGSSVYVGGDFYAAGAPLAAVARVAKLNAGGDLDTSWNPNPTGGSLPIVNALAASESTVYAAGDFTSIGGQPRNDLAALDATTGNATDWNPNPTNNFGTTVDALALSGSTVYVAGGYYSAGFSSIGGQSRRNLAALDATTGNASAWNPSPDNGVSALAVSGSTVYAGGNFTSIGGQSRRILAALDATTGNASAWSPNPTSSFAVPSIVTYRESPVSALAVSGSTVYAAGHFTSIGGQPRSRLAALDATTGNASAFNPSPDNRVKALAVSGPTAYAGGDFTSIGGQPRSSLAALNAATGNARAFNPNPGSVTTGNARAFNPIPGSVNALAVSGSTVYAGGSFSSIDGIVSGPFAVLTDSSAPTDTTAPTITITTPAEGQRFEQGQTVSSVFACSDANGSGVQSCTGPSSVDTTTSGARQFTVTAYDVAGNTATKTINYVVPDTTAPTITITTPAEGQRFEQGQTVSSTYACSDANGTGVQSCTGPSSVNTATTGARQFTVTAYDVAGNTATKTVNYVVDADTTAPTITITTPAEGQRFKQGQTFSSKFACSDANGSGVQSCTGPSSVNTATSGARQFTVTASDVAGNTATKTVNYVVDAPPDSTTAPPPPPPHELAPPPVGLPPPVTLPPALDTTAPAARLTGAAQRLAKTVAVSISCIDEPCTATTVASVRVPRVGAKKAKTYKLSTIRTQIAKGQKVTIKLRLPTPARAAIRRALKASKRIAVTVKLTATDAAGNKRLLSRQVRLKALPLSAT